MCGDSFECVEGAPNLDEAAKSVVWSEIRGGGRLFRGSAGDVLERKQPFLNALSVVRNRDLS